VSIESTTNAFEGEPHLHGFRVSYAFLPPETLERAVEIVGTAIAEERS
jgi:DNA-binding transcriptional MocR family regulator